MDGNVKGRAQQMIINSNRGVRRQSILAQRIKPVNIILQEIMGETNSLLDVDFDDDLTLMAKREAPVAKKSSSAAYQASTF